MSGFRPLFQRGHGWEIHCLLSGPLLCIFVLSEYLMITFRRGGFIFPKVIWWRIGGEGLAAMIVSPIVFLRSSLAGPQLRLGPAARGTGGRARLAMPPGSPFVRYSAGIAPRRFSIFDFRFSISGIAGCAFSAKFLPLGMDDRRRDRSPLSAGSLIENRKSKIENSPSMAPPSSSMRRRRRRGPRVELRIYVVGFLVMLAARRHHPASLVGPGRPRRPLRRQDRPALGGHRPHPLRPRRDPRPQRHPARPEPRQLRGRFLPPGHGPRLQGAQ